MIGHPEESYQVVHDAIEQAWRSIRNYEPDRQPFSTWLHGIGALRAARHLEESQRWNGSVQLAYADRTTTHEKLRLEFGAVMGSSAFSYDASEHVAYCFTCVGRTLEPALFAAVVLRDVVGMSAEEAASLLDVATQVCERNSAAGKMAMAERFAKMCGLQNPAGACNQCVALRAAAPAERRGPEPPPLSTFEERVEVVRKTAIDAGASQLLHDVMWRRTAELAAESDPDEVEIFVCSGKDALRTT